MANMESQSPSSLNPLFEGNSSNYNDMSPRQVRKSEFLFTSEFANAKLKEVENKRMAISDSKFETFSAKSTEGPHHWNYEDF